MSLYAIGDLHLSGAADKPMDIFGEVWKEHTKKLKGAFRHSGRGHDGAAATSWAMSPEQRRGFRFIDSLGKKYVLKAIDYSSSSSQTECIFAKNGISSISLLHNNCSFTAIRLFAEQRAGSMRNQARATQQKIFRRELGRLETSQPQERRGLCFLHYPPRFDSTYVTRSST